MTRIKCFLFGAGRSSARSNPTQGSLQGFVPACDSLVSFFLAHGWLPGVILLPVAAKFSPVGPESDRQAGGVGGAEGGGFANFTAGDGDAEDVGLELHEHVVDGHAAVDFHAGDGLVGVGGTWRRATSRV